MNTVLGWAAGAALVSLLAVSGCGQGSAGPNPAGGGHPPTVSVLADARARVNADRQDSDRVPSPTVRVTGSRVARAATDADCESESVDPRTSCHRYRSAILAAR
jgi:hypothetical protein